MKTFIIKHGDTEHTFACDSREQLDFDLACRGILPDSVTVQTVTDQEAKPVKPATVKPAKKTK